MAREAKGRGLQLPPLKTSLKNLPSFSLFPLQLYQIGFQREPAPRCLKSPRFTPAFSTNIPQTPHLWLLEHLRHSEFQVLGQGWGCCPCSDEKSG